MAVIFKKAKSKLKPVQYSPSKDWTMMLYRTHELAEFLGVKVKDIHVMVDRKIGPTPIELQENRSYVFNSDSVEMWIQAGCPEKQFPSQYLWEDLWKVREWGQDKDERRKNGGPDGVPKGHVWPDFEREVRIE